MYTYGNTPAEKNKDEAENDKGLADKKIEQKHYRNTTIPPFEQFIAK